MKTRDPFLTTLAILFDRLIVWLILVLIWSVLLWSLIWERWLDQDWSETMCHLVAVATGQAVPVVNVLAVLTLTVAILATSLLASWLFARWRRLGEVQVAHVRGSRLGD